MSPEPIELVEGPRDPGVPEDPRTTAVKRAVAALGSDAVEEVEALSSPGLVHVIGGRSPVAGERHGRRALVEAFGALRERCDEPPRFDVAIWLSAGAHVHAVGELVARRGGREGRFAQAHVFEVGDDGRIRSGRVYEDDLYAFDAFFGD